MDLITFLKSQIPSDKRTWLPDSKEWIFDRTYFDIMEFIVIRMWPGAVILTEAVVEKSAAEQSRRRSAMSGTQSDSASVTLRFLELTNLKALPQEHREAKRAYIAAITRLHPDKGGDVTKAAELNVCWEQLEKEAYKK
ncbi:MAG: hypothetical protein Q8P23_00465 [bacterium]|nr:hypothetical protein [bacterium]